MQSEKNKKIGLGIMLLGFLGSIFFFWYFKLNGEVINYRNTPVFLGFILGFLSLLIGLYFGFYFYGGKKLANQIGGGFALLFLVACIFSFLFH
jgi:hypothetical protein